MHTIGYPNIFIYCTISILPGEFSDSIINILKHLEDFWFCVVIHKVTLP